MRIAEDVFRDVAEDHHRGLVQVSLGPEEQQRLIGAESAHAVVGHATAQPLRAGGGGPLRRF